MTGHAADAAEAAEFGKAAVASLVVAQSAAEKPTEEHGAAVPIIVVLVVVMVMLLMVVVMVVLLHDHYLRLGRWLRIDYLRLGCIVDRRWGLVWLVRKLLILVGSVVWSIALVCVHF